MRRSHRSRRPGDDPDPIRNRFGGHGDAGRLRCGDVGPVDSHLRRRGSKLMNSAPRRGLSPKGTSQAGSSGVVPSLPVRSASFSPIPATLAGVITGSAAVIAATAAAVAAMAAVIAAMVSGHRCHGSGHRWLGSSHRCLGSSHRWLGSSHRCRGSSHCWLGSSRRCHGRSRRCLNRAKPWAGEEGR